jgi:hypothetical protein
VLKRARLERLAFSSQVFTASMFEHTTKEKINNYNRLVIEDIESNVFQELLLLYLHRTFEVINDGMGAMASELLVAANKYLLYQLMKIECENHLSYVGCLLKIVWIYFCCKLRIIRRITCARKQPIS